jgi:hypothetical protein
MGAALTYARRYALFTLVGIAGEDDLDAPDLTVSCKESGGKIRGERGSNGRQQTDLAGKRSSSASRQPELPAALSASLRIELLCEIEVLSSPDDAALWARRRLAAKNKLSTADAEHVEQAFQAKLKTYTTGEAGDAEISTPIGRHATHRHRRSKQRQVSVVDKSILALPVPRRMHDREHVKAVAKQPCLICGRRPADAHHLRFAQSRALGRKVSDEFTIPLCRGHHREVHRCGDEIAWWNKTGVDPIPAARVLWLKTHPLPNIIGQTDSKSQDEPNLETSSP